MRVAIVLALLVPFLSKLILGTAALMFPVHAWALAQRDRSDETSQSVISTSTEDWTVLERKYWMCNFGEGNGSEIEVVFIREIRYGVLRWYTNSGPIRLLKWNGNIMSGNAALIEIEFGSFDEPPKPSLIPYSFSLDFGKGRIDIWIMTESWTVDSAGIHYQGTCTDQPSD